MKKNYVPTETTVVHILNDMIGVVDKGRVDALVLLDLSAAFDITPSWLRWWRNGLELTEVLSDGWPTYHLFADDMQGHCRGRPVDCQVLMVKRLERCVTDVSAWCASKRLQLNGDKTQILWFGSTKHLRQVSPTRSATVNNNVIQPATVVRDLGVWIDSELSMRDHVSRVGHLRRYAVAYVVSSAVTPSPPNCRAFSNANFGEL